MAAIPQRLTWTQERAASEFGLNPRTLATRLKQSGAKPDEQGRWSTKQIATAVFGDLELERIRKTRAEADEVERRNSQTDGELVEKDEFCKKYETVYVEMVRIIRTSGLNDTEQDGLLTKLSEAHTAKL
jgi:hypothetical protein